MRVLGVTGTNGKTTTCYLLEAIALAAGRNAGVIGTVETRVRAHQRAARGTPHPRRPSSRQLLARMRDAGVETVAMEVSSHALDQHRVDGTRFAVVVLHESLAGSPRLSRHARRVLRRQGAAVHAARSRDRAAINVDDAVRPHDRWRPRATPASSS